ncbi:MULTISPECIES: bifunctional nicotinamidase/pyrazinamidase [Flammeovirga]|uniref:Nicotinamidase n=1 Tax=Flammeovirga agarivorans TaxID=2726742 RepID=A0A7X8SJ14_9BACT|nr:MULTISPECIES: bifunctional nicotinamidase/pyrazinamidase [Flammeovirga]NLR91047.1 bifunctional nicotinamidase/pyrazinamidase [Flammeovirga agarivorans]
MRALLIVDVQNDFIPGGALEVPEGDQIIPVINSIIPKFDLVVASQDWHPADHKSFAISHSDRDIGEIVDLNGLPQILWPVHCVEGSNGAEFVDALDQSSIKKVFKKGTDKEVDSYSSFYDNDKRHDTGLNQYLKDNNVEEVFIVGLATDYCVKYTALDAKSSDFKTYVIEDATRGVNLRENDVENAFTDLRVSGIKVIQSTALESVFEGE